MPTYFKPLRRKIGVVTLLLACVFAAAWVRSISIRDSLFRMNNWREFHAISNDGLMIGSITSWRPDPKIDKAHLGWKWTSDKVIPFNDRLGDEEGCDLNWQYGRLHFTHVGENSYCRFAVRWVIPCWSIVIPLTLLSAWLILSRPKQKPTSSLA